MCVFWRSLCSNFLNCEIILKDFCVDWIIGWVVCWIAFMSVFFSSWKNCFEKLARHLLDTLLSVKLLKPFSYRNLDSSSILGGSIKKAPASSIAPRHLVDRSSFWSWNWFFVARYLLDTSAVDDQFLDTSCTSIEQTLFKQIVTGDKVLDLVHLFLLKKLLCSCTVGFWDQASFWSSLCGWTEELCSQQSS